MSNKQEMIASKLNRMIDEASQVVFLAARASRPKAACLTFVANMGYIRSTLVRRQS